MIMTNSYFSIAVLVYIFYDLLYISSTLINYSLVAISSITENSFGVHIRNNTFPSFR
jgi:hypothetical protein